MARGAGSNITTDHEEIQRWAEERGAKPTCVRGTGDANDTGILRLDFPGYSGGDSLEEISWDDWFQKFDEQGLALLHQDTTAGGDNSNFNKLVSRETAQAAQEGNRSNSGSSRGSGTRARSSATSRSGAKSKARTGASRSGASRSGSSSSRRKSTSAKASSARTGSRSTARKSESTRSRSTAAKPRSTSSRGGSRKSASSRRASSGSSRSGGRATANRSGSSRAESSRGNSGSGSRRGSSRSASSRSHSTGSARKSASTRSQGTRARSNATSRSRSGATAKRGTANRSGSRSNARGSSQSRGSRSSAKSRTLTDHAEIRQWAEARKAKPACVVGTGKRGDTGMIRLDFPGFSGAGSLRPISWDDWFESFDNSNLALVVQEKTARGQQSNFNKLIGRETAGNRARGSKASRRHPERGQRSSNVRSISTGRGDRDQRESSRGSNRGARTGSARGQNSSTRRRAA